jgi:hypothetical protein
MMSLLQKLIVHEDLVAGIGKVMGVGARDVVEYGDRALRIRARGTATAVGGAVAASKTAE